MDIAYHAFRMLFDNKPFFAPIGDNPQEIVDIGTGTGIWAIDVGDAYPSARVRGTDLSPIQPIFVPPNVVFQIDDCLEYPWTFKENSIDLVHTRDLHGWVVNDWVTFYKESFRVLQPGGYVESQEFDCMDKCDDDSLPPNSAVHQWFKLLNEGAVKSGINLRLKPSDLVEAMEEAGFVDIEVKTFKLPFGPWSSEKKLKQPGIFTLVSMLEGLSGISAGLFTRYLGWDMNRLEVLLAATRANGGRRKSIHM
ncbi:hypothetical protein BP5796_13123 [Coleophoma crateriformis]|uniref:S-adenosyl-L-methionine-dependent methyltransferase n=1 Tax=Coleophoma crateriformis TaxID=565419 RepID=A0A3D8Q3Q4_9HELO|nr:hypothetical protein BP5796_13123 [Coleophoma crateriformis]